jgi:hypothetical protein
MSDEILSFQYRESSDIDISFHFDIGRNQYRIFRYQKLINHSQMTQVKFYEIKFLSLILKPSVFMSSI